MNGVYRIVRPDGRVEYTDTPSGPGTIDDRLGSGGVKRDAPAKPPPDHKAVVSAIKEVQKRVPKLIDYLDYLDYLRHSKPWAFDAAMKELQRTDIKAYLALQKYPQFRPLSETVVGIKAGEKSVTLGIGLATSGVGGSAEKWMETTLKDMMKRDRWGPYAKVLGSKASTLPAPPAPTYSNSRLGQYLQTDDARAAKAAKASADALEKAKAGARAARGASVTRVMGPIVDLGLGALNPDTASGVSAMRGQQIAKRLVDAGILDSDEALLLPRLMARGDFAEANRMIEAGMERAKARQ